MSAKHEKTVMVRRCRRFTPRKPRRCRQGCLRSSPLSRTSCIASITLKLLQHLACIFVFRIQLQTLLVIFSRRFFVAGFEVGFAEAVVRIGGFWEGDSV